ncbi:AmmeMemoRadiSam system protein A [Catenovulum maritimum]|uniref:AMMECR1 domain-containing protein n=1 Tax=Catenovulum maritimum TaxID=1513271 RepID=A0A0J8GNN9_9ALTE|nr:AmmeMemoRadiSam system protein A [Catenovulum maritimum]KMT64402.1 hypothetical protein XM47_14585 [Catenovulum maritimum]
MNCFPFKDDAELKNSIISLANQAISYAFLHNGDRLPDHLIVKNPELCESMACFVSLSEGEMLRGCVGTTVANDRLDTNIAWYAHEAAFHDPRFDPIQREDLTKLTVKVSLLSKPLPLVVENEAHLLEQLVPNKDGLIIQYGQLTGVFLPCMWQKFNSPEAFLVALKEKAGWPQHSWTQAMKASVFQTYYFEGPLG